MSMTEPHVLYIAGMGRSGSTLLDRLLGDAPGWASGGELADLWRHGVLEDRLCTCGQHFSACSFWQTMAQVDADLLSRENAHRIAEFHDRALRTVAMRLLATPSGRQRFLASAPPDYGNLLHRLYEAYCQVSQAPLVIDSSKGPNYLFLLASLANVRVRVLHLLRDPRAVAFSWQRVRIDPGGDGVTMLRYKPHETAALWSVWNWATEYVCHTLDISRMQIRYEELISKPEATVAAIRAFGTAALDSNPPRRPSLGDEPSAHAHIISGNPSRFSGTPRIVEDREWEALMSVKDRLTVTALSLPAMGRYGYSAFTGSRCRGQGPAKT